MQTLRLDCKILCKSVFGIIFIHGAEGRVGLNFHHTRGDIRQHKEVRILIAFCQQFCTLFGQFHLAIFFIDGKQELLIYQVHILRLLLHVVVLRFLQDYPHTLFAQKLDERPVLGECAVCTQQRHAPFAFLHTRVALLDSLAGCRKELCCQFSLRIHQSFHMRLQLYILLIISPLRYRP